jgi:hypothetical protein
VRRNVLYLAAALFLAFEQWSFYQWITTHGSVSAGMAHAWASLQADPMVFMAWNDMGVFTLIVLIWLARDLRANRRSMLWWPATLIFGCPPLLIYLARNPSALRPTPTGSPTS